MPHDPELVAETRAWLAKAWLDLAAADHELTAEPPLVEDIVFHAQQAVRSPSRRCSRGMASRFERRTISRSLAKQSIGVAPELRASVDRAVPLTEHAWKFRYPGGPAAPPRDEAQSALTSAREMFEAILRQLPEEVRP